MFGNMAVYFNLNITDFKQKMGLKGYIDPNLTMKEMAIEYGILEEKIINYLQPFIRYNGYYASFKNGFLNALLASLFVTGSIIPLGGFLSAMTGSVLARFRKKWHLNIYNVYMLSMIIPGSVIMLPTFLIMTKYLRLYDNYLALIFLGIQGGAIPIMIFTSYISSIPEELKESVLIDGGSHIRYFFSILLPNCTTPFAAYVAIMLPTNWNNMLNGILYLKQEHMTLPALVNTMNGTYTTNLQAIYAGLFISMVPLLIVFIIFQSLFVKSTMLGAVKG
jgi:ABC-type glycerol-3-phosphate transport system permease component